MIFEELRAVAQSHLCTALHEPGTKGGFEN